MDVAIILAVFIVVLAADFPLLRQSTSLLEKLVYIVLMAFSFCILLLNALGVSLPSPSQWIITAVKAIIPSVGP